MSDDNNPEPVIKSGEVNPTYSYIVPPGEENTTPPATPAPSESESQQTQNNNDSQQDSNSDQGTEKTAKD